MKMIGIIAWKEFRMIVTSARFFFVAAFCSIVWTVMYLNQLNQFARQSMMAAMGQGEGTSVNFTVFFQHISLINFIFILAIPAFTMRLLAEEKKMRTFDLLLTSPITAAEIAVGKFFGAYGVALVLIAVSALYPIATRFVTDFNWTVLAVNYMGIILLAGVYVAAGLFASSVTDSAMLSVFLGMIMNILIWFIGAIMQGAESQFVTALSDHISIGQQLFHFMKGTIRTSSIVFFISIIAVFVFLSERVVESARWR
jgi:ABC-2 type transport system permease protein